MQNSYLEIVAGLTRPLKRLLGKHKSVHYMSENNYGVPITKLYRKN